MKRGSYDLAITIGYLLAPYFFKRKYNAIFGNTSSSNNFNINYPMQGKSGTGRGGFPWDYNISTGVSDGDDGIPPVCDAFFHIESCLTGSGGSNSGGAGYQDGSLGRGGDGLVEGGDIGYPGGGAGFFGGGSGLLGGAGGGSSAVIIDTLLEFIDEVFDRENKPNIKVKQTADIQGGLLLGTEERKNSYSGALYALNTEWSNYYTKHIEPYLSNEAYEQFLNIRTQANGNGFILISQVNKEILLDKDKGYINLDRIIYMNPDDPAGGIPVDFSVAGDYHIICFGACGGSFLQWSEAFPYWAGGFGGSAGAIFSIPSNTTLYAFIGGKGNRSIGEHPINGGGNCSNHGTSGGGATDLRYVNNVNALKTRIIVAGGGGGVYGLVEDVTEPPRDYTIPNIVDRDYIDSGTLGVQTYLVNDLSTVHVSLNFAKTSNTRDKNILKLKLKIQDVDQMIEQTIDLTDVNSLTKSNIPLKVSFPLDTVYPVNTPTHRVTISAYWESDADIFIYSNSVIITVTTEPRENESSNFEHLPLILSFSETVRIKENLGFVVITTEQGEDHMISIREYVTLIDTANLLIKAIKDKYIHVDEFVSLHDFIQANIGSDIPMLNKLLSMSESISVDDALVLLEEFIKNTNKAVKETMILGEGFTLKKG